MILNIRKILIKILMNLSLPDVAEWHSGRIWQGEFTWCFILLPTCENSIFGLVCVCGGGDQNVWLPLAHISLWHWSPSAEPWLCPVDSTATLHVHIRPLSVLSDPTNFIQTLGFLGQTVEFSTFSLDRGQPFSESIIYLKLQEDC